MALSTTATISGLPAEIIAEIFWKLLESFDDSENDSEDQFHDRARWHYGCLARLCLTCKRWRNVAEHAPFWTLFSSSIPKPVRTKVLRLSGNLPLDVTHDHRSGDKEVRSPETEGFMPQDMIDAFPRWKTALLWFEDVEHVPPEIYCVSSHQLEKLELHVDDTSDETWRGLLGGNTNALRHLRLDGAGCFFPTSPLTSLRELYIDDSLEPSLEPITILAALLTTPMLRKLTLYLPDSESDSSAEPLQTIGLVELPHLEVFRLHMKADVAISLLQHITSTSCHQLKAAVSFEEPPRVAELRQALTGFLPCIQRAVEASSRTCLSILLFGIKGQRVQMATDAAAPNTFTLTLSFARDWSSEAFQWMGDLVAPLSHNDPFVTISLVTGESTYIPRQFASSAPGGWTETILLMPCVRILDLGRELAPMRSFFNRLSEPIDVPGGSPRWPLASLKRLITQPHCNSPLELLQLLKARRGQGTESGHLAPPGHLAELVLRVGGRGLDKEWAEHIPAIEEALKPGRLLIQ